MTRNQVGGHESRGLGNRAPATARAPERVVSLVPSLTESMFDLGLGSAVVGISDFCVRPSQATQSLPRVGGTKDPRVAQIRSLEPDLILANREENPPEAIRALEDSGLRVWVSFPKTVRAALEVLRELAALFLSSRALMQVHSLEVAVEYAGSAAAEDTPVRLFCPIWQAETWDGVAWWMTFNRETYAHDLLRLVGGENVFADRERRFPLEAELGQAAAQLPEGRDTRYPRLGAAEILAAAPDLILLPDEPFAFDQSHLADLASRFLQTPAGTNGRLVLLDGSLITWHGTRLAAALRELPGLIQGQEGSR